MPPKKTRPVSQPPSLPLSHSLSLPHPLVPSLSPLTCLPHRQFDLITDDPRRRRRSLTMVTPAGLSSNSYMLAFLLHLPLFSATIFSSIRIADMLDQDYLEEVHWFLNSQSFVKWVVLVSCFRVLFFQAVGVLG